MQRQKVLLEKQLLETKLEVLELADSSEAFQPMQQMQGAAVRAPPNDELIPAVHSASEAASQW